MLRFSKRNLWQFSRQLIKRLTASAVESFVPSSQYGRRKAKENNPKKENIEKAQSTVDINDGLAIAAKQNFKTKFLGVVMEFPVG